jgi:hypothetical protein
VLRIASAPEGADGIAFGSWDEVLSAGLSSTPGEGGGVGYPCGPPPRAFITARKLSRPLTFGKSHWYMTFCGSSDRLLRTCSRISEEFAICKPRQRHTTTMASIAFLTWGTHFGATNDPASMYWSPVCASLSTSSILVATGIDCFSFCNPSLGPTSTMRTWSARLDAAVARVLRWHGCRAARRADRRQTNFEDIVVVSAVCVPSGLWGGLNCLKCGVRHSRALVVGNVAGMTLHRGWARTTNLSLSLSLIFSLYHSSFAYPSALDATDCCRNEVDMLKTSCVAVDVATVKLRHNLRLPISLHICVHNHSGSISQWLHHAGGLMQDHTSCLSKNRKCRAPAHPQLRSTAHHPSDFRQVHAARSGKHKHVHAAWCCEVRFVFAVGD